MTTEPAHTISSPGAFGSGELKIQRGDKNCDPDRSQPTIWAQLFKTNEVVSESDVKISNIYRTRGPKGPEPLT